MTKTEILQPALAQRIDEVMGYQINIDNYRLALVHMEALADPDLTEFAAQIKTLLDSEILEQKKASVMLAIIKQQLEV